jgi:hypothetical protein
MNLSSNLYVNVKKRRNDFSERERKILSVLLLNMTAQSNSQITKVPTVLKENNVDEEDLLNYQLIFQNAIDRESLEKLKGIMALNITKALRMCGIDGFRITYNDKVS